MLSSAPSPYAFSLLLRITSLPLHPLLLHHSLSVPRFLCLTFHVSLCPFARLCFPLQPRDLESWRSRPAFYSLFFNEACGEPERCLHGSIFLIYSTNNYSKASPELIHTAGQRMYRLHFLDSPSVNLSGHTPSVHFMMLSFSAHCLVATHLSTFAHKPTA